MSYFYSQYVVIESVLAELDNMELSEEERKHLAVLLESSLHHAILDEILSNLNEEDKKLFLHHLHQEVANDKIMDFLQGKIEGVEEKIKKVSDDLIKEMHKDIKEAKR